MVQLTRYLLKGKRSFIDKLRVHVRGGPGGQGHPKYGGQGGRGGHVFVEVHPRATLKKIISGNPTKRFQGGKGENSKVQALLGASGGDVSIQVPPGVVVRTDDHVLGELNEVGDRILAAKGGDGGHSKNNFLGQKGEGHSVTLDLKLIADIGLVGFPNAGKSTFLAAISRTKPKIADYPFTTIQPQIGTMMYDDLRQITVADLPGLIEGAHMNIGMGHSFLKHVERTKLLLFMVDINGFQLADRFPYRTAFETILLLMKELELYKLDLAHKPAVLALNKTDTVVPGNHGDTDVLAKVMEQVNDMQGAMASLDPDLCPENLIQFDAVIPISAKNRENTDLVKDKLRTLLDIYADLELEEEKQDTESLDSKLNEHFGGKRFV